MRLVYEMFLISLLFIVKYTPYKESIIENKCGDDDTNKDIKILMAEECIIFNIDKNYQYYEIHSSIKEKKVNLHMMHFPSITE